MYGEDPWFEEPGDELDDNEYPDEDDLYDEPTSTFPCPDCGTELHEDAVMCPICGIYITHDTDRVWSGRPGWWIVLGLLGILAVILTLSGLFRW